MIQIMYNIDVEKIGNVLSEWERILCNVVNHAYLLQITTQLGDDAGSELKAINNCLKVKWPM